MTRKPYTPSPLLEVSARASAERWTLVLVRELHHAPDKVWSALTDPAQLSAWAPFDVDRNLSSTGPALLTMAGGGPSEPMSIRVRDAEVPKLLVYEWGGDLLRWELERTPNGTRLTLCHTLSDKSMLPKVAAGWHICIDVAERSLAGEPIGRIVGEAARDYGWGELNDAYAKKLDKA